MPVRDSCRVRTEPGNFSWRRASARWPSVAFGTKAPPGRAVPRKILKRGADPTKFEARHRARPFISAAMINDSDHGNLIMLSFRPLNFLSVLLLLSASGIA